MIDKLLKNIPDKTEWKSTTSHKFKRDLWDFCTQDEIFKELTVVELGTHVGHTTKILSHLFNEVITVNNQSQDAAKELNKDRNNIVYEQFDLYQNSWTFSKGDVIFIDAVHEYGPVLKDVENSLKLKSIIEKKIFVFDDYGMWLGVQQAVNKLISDRVLEVLGYIGHKSGFTINNSNTTGTTNNFEGIICQEI